MKTVDLSKKIFVEEKEAPIMVMQRVPFDMFQVSIADVEGELRAHAEKNNTLVWGYYTSMNDGNEAGYEMCVSMAQQLRKQVVEKIDHRFQLAFIRGSIGKQDSGIGGLHLDSHIDSRPVQDVQRKPDEEVLRLLVNLGTAPRTIGFSDLRLKEIEEQGGKLTQMGYTKVDLPQHVEMKTVELPPREKNAIWALTFWASVTPHTGIDDERGHLLAGYGMYEHPARYKL